MESTQLVGFHHYYHHHLVLILIVSIGIRGTLDLRGKEFGDVSPQPAPKANSHL